jgi:tetratricopeptide (TPR) repeat protein
MPLQKTIRFAALAAMLALLPNLANAVDDPSATSTVDLTSVRAKIAAKDYKAAISELKGLAEDSQSVDVYNLLGFSLRKSGDYPTSLTYYNKALQLQPDFKPAREYLGELYLDMGDMTNAKVQLTKLETLCPDGCEERSDLQKAIAAKAAN